MSRLFSKYDHICQILYQEILNYNVNNKPTKLSALLKKRFNTI